ncbi:MAG: PAS domain S-box protein [Planctomycetaceae bacterium]|nr:PAS domain S-box protein [Planctomycetaceae bacterium]
MTDRKPLSKLSFHSGDKQMRQTDHPMAALDAEEIAFQSESILSPAECSSSQVVEVLFQQSFLKVVDTSTTFPTIITDELDRVVWLNRAFEELCGWEASDLLGHPIWYRLHGPATDLAAVAAIRQKAEHRLPVNEEVLNYRKNGEPYWVAIDSKPVFDPSNRFVGYLSIQTDITVRRRAESKLSVDHLLLQSISDVQSRFIDSDHDDNAFRTLLEHLLEHLLGLTQSQHGFIAELNRADESGHHQLEIAASGAAADAGTHPNSGDGNIWPFGNVSAVFDCCIRNREACFWNVAPPDFPKPQQDQVSAGLLTYAGIPVWTGGEVKGLLGLANRIEGYDAEIVDFIEPLLKTIAQLIDARRRRREQEALEASLREAKAFLALTGRVAGVGGWQLNLDSGFLEWTEQTRRIHEVDEDYVPTLSTAIDFYTVEARGQIASAVEMLQVTGTPFCLELPLVTAKGRRIWVRAQGEREDHEGKPYRLYGTFQEVTKIIWAERFIKCKNRILELIISGQPSQGILEEISKTIHEQLLARWVMVLTRNSVTNRLIVTSSFGWPDGLAETLNDVPANCDNRIWGDVFVNGRRSAADGIEGDPLWGPMAAYLRDNNISHSLSLPVSATNAPTDCCFTICSTHSLLAGKFDHELLNELIQLATIAVSAAAENEKLLNSESRLREASRRAGLGYWLLDVKTGKVEWSEEIYRMLRRDDSFQPTLERFIEELAHPEDRNLITETYLKVCQTPGLTCEIDIRTNPADGPVKWLAIEGVASTDFDGKVVYVRGTILDITERVAASNEKTALQTQLLHAQKMESVGRLAGGVAHDFNNMLAVMLGHCEMLLLRDSLSVELREHLNAIQSAGQRSADLTRQLLTFARRQNASPRVLKLNQSVTSILQMLKRLLPDGILLSWQPSPGLWDIHIDPVQIDQVLSNLLVNSRDAIDGNGTIAIATQNCVVREPRVLQNGALLNPGEWVLLSVSDDGCGIDEEGMQRLFEPFYTTKPLGEGTGLGLATVFGIVQQNEGVIEAISDQKTGTSIRVFFPRCQGTAIRETPPQESLPAKQIKGIVLLVEDEQAVLQIGRIFLQQLGYTVLTASRPTEAIRRFEMHEGEIRLVITDMMMPEMSGRQLISSLRRFRSDLPCLLMSGYLPDLPPGSEFLHDDIPVIPKPFEIQTLAAAIRLALNRAESSGPG